MPPRRRIVIDQVTQERIIQGASKIFGRILEAAVDSGLEQVEEALEEVTQRVNDAHETVKKTRRKVRRPAPPR